jgi:hypothetical protein
MKKKLIIFITGLHNKPQGCGESVACAAGPFTTKKTLQISFLGVYKKLLENIYDLNFGFS